MPAEVAEQGEGPAGQRPAVAPAASAPNATAVRATAAPSRSQGSHRPVARSGSPNGP